MKILNLDITRLGHDTFRIAGSKVVYTDPYKLDKPDKADVVLISHDHFDHLSSADLKKVCSDKTQIVASKSCKEGLKGVRAANVQFVGPGDTKTVDGIEVKAVAAYNTNKFKEPGKVFHPRQEGHVGFVINLDGTRVYFAGDTDYIPEMDSIQCDIALLPVSGTYVMTAEEAAKAANAIKPKVAVPMHYGAIVGSENDAHKFKSLVRDARVEIV